MLDLFIAQADSLSADWVKWIVGGMAGAVIGLAYFVKWIITTILSKAEEGLKSTWTEAKDMHNGAMERFDKSLTIGIENKATLEEIKTDNKETKYAIQTLNTKVRCTKEEGERHAS